jgi:hypothetical protein
VKGKPNTVLVFHGTTDTYSSTPRIGPLTQGICQQIRIDAATNTAMGKGFYVTLDINEAFMYGCFRNKGSNKDVLVLAIEIQDAHKLNVAMKDQTQWNGKSYYAIHSGCKQDGVHMLRNENNYPYGSQGHMKHQFVGRQAMVEKMTIVGVHVFRYNYKKTNNSDNYTFTIHANDSNSSRNKCEDLGV